MPDTVPASGRLLGIDFGTVRIGIAICDATQTIASPFENYKRRSQDLDAVYFARLATAERVVGLVIGLPLHLSGDESPKSAEARAFGNWLAKQTSLPVRYHDERYSSALAEDLLNQAGLTRKQRKERLDKLAAQMILTSYLEAKANGNLENSAGSIDGSQLPHAP